MSKLSVRITSSSGEKRAVTVQEKLGASPLDFTELLLDQRQLPGTEK
jgi:hypothetical protein